MFFYAEYGYIRAREEEKRQTDRQTDRQMKIYCGISTTSHISVVEQTVLLSMI